MNHNLVTVDIFPDSLAAHIAKGKLESEGISCFLKNESIINNTGLNFTYGGIELMTREEDEKRAKAILEERG